MQRQSERSRWISVITPWRYTEAVHKKVVLLSADTANLALNPHADCGTQFVATAVVEVHGHRDARLTGQRCNLCEIQRGAYIFYGGRRYLQNRRGTQFLRRRDDGLHHLHILHIERAYRIMPLLHTAQYLDRRRQSHIYTLPFSCSISPISHNIIETFHFFTITRTKKFVKRNFSLVETAKFEEIELEFI